MPGAFIGHDERPTTITGPPALPSTPATPLPAAPPASTTHLLEKPDTPPPATVPRLPQNEFRSQRRAPRHPETPPPDPPPSLDRHETSVNRAYSLQSNRIPHPAPGLTPLDHAPHTEHPAHANAHPEPTSPV